MADPLPGDAITRLLREREALPLPERERGSTDPQTVAEFLAYDLPFEQEPAFGFLPPTPPEERRRD